MQKSAKSKQLKEEYLTIVLLISKQFQINIFFFGLVLMLRGWWISMGTNSPTDI